MPHPPVQAVQRQRLIIVAVAVQLSDSNEWPGAIAAQRGETEHRTADDHRVSHPDETSGQRGAGTARGSPATARQHDPEMDDGAKSDCKPEDSPPTLKPPAVAPFPRKNA